ncbi:MAG: single-stranded DNA-binding protein, partial [Dehalococcoidia bacterium]|nr:single-stranded DNA-binding protein [Dehalococcoidia bacterium]
YGPPNDSPARALLQGEPALVIGRVENDIYQTASGLRVGAVHTVADQLVIKDQSVLHAEISGVIRSVAKSRSDSASIILSVKPLGRRHPVELPVRITGQPRAELSEGRYIHLKATPTAENAASADMLRAEARDITMLDTRAKPGGSGIGQSALHAVGSFTERPTAQMIILPNGASAAVAHATLLTETDGRETPLRISVWRGAAEIVHEYADKGDRIYVSGSLLPARIRDGRANSELMADISYVRMI